MELSSDSHVPKYAQIADIFRQRIARGIWAQGLRLPANEDLATEFGVSRERQDAFARLLIREILADEQWMLSTQQNAEWQQQRRSSAAVPAKVGD
jgi:GntR family transcriptional regulator